MIPKIIHYIWIGGNPKSELILSCISSWERLLPEYQIIEWNENSYDVLSNPYIAEAYQKKKWAFVSDYMRFDILYKYGGIYLDTDVEFLKPIPERFLEYGAFTGMESNYYIAPGLIYAANKGDLMVKRILDSFEKDGYKFNPRYTICDRVTELFKTEGYCVEQKNQVIYNTAIYTDDYFCGYDKDLHEVKINSNTISVHHYSASWQKPSLKKCVSKLIKKAFGIKTYIAIVQIKRSLFGISGERK